MIAKLGPGWIMACAAICAAGTGCAINGKGLVGDGRQYRENSSQTGRSVTVDVWGINLSTIEGDRGVTLGRTRRTYYLPGPASTRPADPAQHLSGSDDTRRLATTQPFDWESARPLAIRSRTDGASVSSDLAGAGVTLGTRAFEAVTLPRDGNTFLLIKSRATRPADDVFHVKEFQR